MFFSSDVNDASNVVIFDLPTEVGAIVVEINAIFVPLLGVKVATSGAKIVNVFHVEELGRQHSKGTRPTYFGSMLDLFSTIESSQRYLSLSIFHSFGILSYLTKICNHHVFWLEELSERLAEWSSCALDSWVP